MQTFKTAIKIIGVNPYVSVPDKVLKELFKQSGKEKGPIQIRGSVNQKPYRQTLVKFSGEWRLYINLAMLKNSTQRIGEIIELQVEFDPEPRIYTMHPKFEIALKQNKAAQEIFDKLSPSRQMEINRYLSFLKTEESINRNVLKAIDFLLGKTRFVGRDKP